MSGTEKVYQAVLEGASKGVGALVQEALDAGIPAEVVLNEGLIAAMAEVGKLFEEGEYFVPEMLISARAMKVGLGVLRPQLVLQDVKPLGKVVIGTVKGDLHDIGKNLVSMMLEGGGFEIVDLGTDVSPEAFVAAVNEHHPNLLGMSALLTTTMPNMKATILLLEQANLRQKVKVMVGGAPITADFARLIGADGFSGDASKVVALAKSLI